MASEADSLTATLTEWAATSLGEPVTLTRVPGGGRHGAWRVTGASGAWFVKADTAPPPAYEHCTLRLEADMYRAAAAAGAPVPTIVALHPQLEAALMTSVDGDAAYAKLPDDEKTSIADHLADVLAAMHATDASTLAPWVEVRGTMADHVRIELDVWEGRFRSAGTPDPLIEACFQWLRDHVPDTGDAPPRLVQGDTGPGNLLHDGARITALLDFELAHLGDPLEDLAWVGTRSAQEPVPDMDRFLARYAATSGTALDAARLRYHSLLAELRIAVLGVERQDGHVSELAEHGNHIIYGSLHRRLTVEAFAAALCAPMPDVAPLPAAGSADTRYFDGILAQLDKIVVPAIDDPFAKRRAKSMARVVKYLREADRVGDAAVAAELDDLTAVLGHRPADVTAGVTELYELVAARRIGVAQILPWAAGQVLRRQQVAAPSMGVLATRHLPVYR